jgi:radical SAM superfamily enzyme YgiQ (UPF0313 family)
MSALLLATYEMGRQPFGLASPAAWLREAGVEVAVCDLSRQPLDEEAARRARLIACYLPMHTATRLVAPVARRVSALNPVAHLCAFGLYAPLNEEHLRALGFGTILGPEFEADLVDLARHVESVEHPTSAAGSPGGAHGEVARIPHLAFRVPDRTGLPPAIRYASLRRGSQRIPAGYTEASRGCKHRCRHCPIVPVYQGRFRVVPVDVVIADVRQQVERGVRHITFGDPDFFNGPRHALAIAEAMHSRVPGLTYDVTIKVEHLLRHRELLPRLRETGCLFVTSAVESFDDRILARLAKGHTRADVVRALEACREAGLTLVPTFVAFTPWTTLQGYVTLLATLADLNLVDAVAPVQLSIRLLITHASLLLHLPDIRSIVQPFDGSALVHPWAHPDPAVDALQRRVSSLIGRHVNQSRRSTFRQVWHLTRDMAGLPSVEPFAVGTVAARTTIPWLDEPWYC